MVAWLTVKAVAIFLGLATTAFCVSTIVLAVQNADLENDLQDALDKIDALTADTTSTSTTTTTTSPVTPDPGLTSPTTPGTTPGGGGEVSTPDAGSSSTSSSGTTPGGQTTPDGGSSSSTTTSVAPIYPELPTGLPDPEAIEWRLPTELRPIKYKLYYQPDLQTGACEGTVSIQFQLNNVTNLIVLHAKDLNVHSISILNMMARMRIAIEEWYLDETRELLMIKLREVLSLNKAYTLSASFDCDLSSLTGSYLSSYTGSEGIVK